MSTERHSRLIPRVGERSSRRGQALGKRLREAWEEYERDHARYFAVAMVYYALVSLVPLLLLMLAALGLALRLSDLGFATEQHVLDLVQSRFGTELREVVDRLFDQLQQQSVIATLVSLAALLLTASKLFKHLRLSFRAIWNYAPPLVSGSMRGVARTTALEQVIAFGMVFMGAVLLVISLSLMAVVQWLNAWVGRLPILNEAPAWLLALPAPLFVVTLTFGLLLKFLPPRPLPWRHVWLAAVLCGAACIIGTELLVLYGTLFGGHSAYGALGGLLVIMLWMNAVSQMLFFGAELCKVVAKEGR